MGALGEIFKSVGATRLLAVGMVLIGFIGFFIFLATKFSSSEMALLYSEIDQSESSAVVSKLEEMGVPYQLGGNGTRIMVPADQVLRLRLAMTEDGLVSPEGGTGYELFDEDDKLVTSQFVQNINHLRALEGELSRTIQKIGPVRGARVHLVLPQRELFSKNKQPPSASIVIKTKGRNKMSPANVQAIQHLVAAAVPGLTPENVSVVDHQGNLLAKGIEEQTLSAHATTSEELRINHENRLVFEIEQLVGNIVGHGKVRAEVSADLDLDRITEESEIYDPEGQVVRSTTVMEETNQSENKEQPPVTVQQNIPEGVETTDAEFGMSNESSRVEEVTNFEISRTVKSYVKETGVVRRLSVAVLIDGLYPVDEEGVKTYEPRDEEQLKKIEELIKSAVGYDEERGDQIKVINMQFASLDENIEEEQTIFGMSTEEVMEMFQVIVLGIVGILFLILIVRPLVKRLVETIPTAATQAQLLTSQLAAIDERAAMMGPEGLPMLTGADGAAIPEADFDSMIDIGRVEGKVRASSIKKVGEIIERHTDESVSIIRNWIYQDLE